MEASPKIRAFIKLREKYSGRAYLCPAGKLTIGWGHTGTDVFPDSVITPQIGEGIFNRDIDMVEECIEQTVNVALSQNMFDALVSFIFNIGRTKWRTSTMLALLNKGKVEEASKQLQRWVWATVKDKHGHEHKVVLPGLVERRALEYKLFTEVEG